MNVFLLPEISKTTLNGIKSTDVVPKPLNSSGYNYYTTQTNDAIFKLINEPENVNRKFYYIIEKLTEDTPSYENNIETISKKYFGQKVSYEFLQLWELFNTFDIITKTVSTNDKTAEEVFDKLKKFADVKVIKNKKFSHLVMLNEIKLNNSFVTELNISKKITKFIDNLDNLEKGGHFIVKVQELISPPSLSLIYMLSYLFENVYVYRPELSLSFLGEKYIVCTNYLDKKFNFDTKKDFLDLEMTIPSDYIFTLNIINRFLMQEEYIIRNKIRAYINSQNYFGDEYHDALSVQQNNSDKWISNNLMLSAKDYKDLQKIKQNNLNKSLSEFKSFVMSKIKINL